MWSSIVVCASPLRIREEMVEDETARRREEQVSRGGRKQGWAGVRVSSRGVSEWESSGLGR